MQQLLSLWKNLDTSKRMIVIGTTLAVFIGVLSLSRMASQENLSLLYSGLAPDSAGEVLSALESQNVPFEVRGNSIFVTHADRDRLRLSLASQGLPASGGAGYELLDSMTGFGTTSQMFDVAYLRAKEGELARTIVANPQIKAARVHIAQAENTPFRQTLDPTASVALQSTGNAISPDTAESIRHLVASAVAGLQPTNVSVIDAANGTVITSQDAGSPSVSESNRSAALKQNVLRLIEARTGVGRAVVEVNVETVSEEEVIVERRVDPESRIAISTDSQQNVRSSQNSGNSGVTVASNLPDGDAAAGGGEASSNDNETREVINYEVSQTTREIKKVPGSIARLSVAVLVDGTRTANADGTENWQPRSEEEITVLTDLVKSAVGYNEARGDIVTIRSMDLTEAPTTIPAEGDGWVNSTGFDMTTLIKPIITAVVVLALGLFVLRPVLLSGREPNLLQEPQLIGSNEQDQAGEPDFMMASAPALGAPEDMGGGMDLPMADFSQVGMESFDEDPVARLRNLIEERQDETVEVLRNWIEEPEETA